MGIGAAIGGSALLGAYSANQAAQAQEDAANTAASVERERLAEDKRRYEEMAPYRLAGIEQVGSLSDILSGRTDPTKALEESAGYKFRLGQSQTALDRFMAARGGRLGGRAIKEATRYGQDFASNEYQNFLGNKFRLAGFSGQPTPAPGSQLPNLALASGNAQAGAWQGYNQAAQGGLQNYMTYSMYQNMMNQGGGGGGTGSMTVPTSTLNTSGLTYG